MGDASFLISSFLGGEFSKTAQGRADLPEYATAMNLCYNGLPLEPGAWTRRPGSALADTGLTRAGAPARLIAVDFKQSAPYQIEFTDGHLRFIAGRNLATTNDDAAVTSISTANPAVMTLTTPVTWATGDQVFFKGLTTATPLLANRLFTLTKTSTTIFSLADAITGASINGATLGTLPAGVTCARVLDIASPYSGGAWATTRSVQAETRAILLNGAVAPYTLDATPPAGTTFATFALAAAVFKDGPYLDPFTNGVQATPSAMNGVINITLSFAAYDSTKAYAVGDYVTSSSVNYRSLTATNQGNTPAGSPSNWVAVNASEAISPLGFTGSDIGRMVRLFSEPPLWVVGGSYTATTSVVAYNGAYYTCLTNNTGSLSNAPNASLTTWAINPTGAIWTWGKITALLNMIDRSLAGSTSIGDLTLDGGLAALFDGSTVKAFSACAVEDSTRAQPERAYGGKNYSGASAQKIASVTIFPSSDRGLFYPLYATSDGHQFFTAGSFQLNLRGKSTAPSSGSDGTLLGSATGDVTIVNGAVYNPYLAPINITSNDQATTWNYVWVECLFTYVVPGDANLLLGSFGLAQLQFFSPQSGTSGNGVSLQILGDALLYTTPVRKWRLGVYSQTTGYPTSGVYHEGRLWLSGVVGNRCDASNSNDLFNFAPTNAAGQVADNNAIAAVFNASDVNSIFWMSSDKEGIVCGTQAGEWLIRATDNNNPITPTNIQAHRVSRNGCANIEPRRAGLTLAVVHRFKHTLYELFADVFSGRFASPDLTKWCKHLSTRGIEEIAYQKELAPVLWARCADGSLIGLTYKRESLSSAQGPNFAGAHQHALGSGRVIESISAGASGASATTAAGQLDTLYMVTNDTATGIRHVEFLTNIFEEGAALKDAWHVDSGITPSLTQSATVAGLPSYVMSGLWPLNGKTVAVWAGGLDCGDYVVSNGAVTVPFGAANGLFTATFVASFTTTAMPIAVGFTYTSKGQILRGIAPQATGARNGPALGKKRNINQFAVLLVNSLGLSFGTTFTALNAASLKTPGEKAWGVSTAFNGVHWDKLGGDSTFDEMICWQVTRPYPATIAALEGFLHTSDK